MRPRALQSVADTFDVGQTQLRNAFLQSFQQEFSPDLEKIRRCGLEVKQEIKLAKVKADLQDQKLQQLEREAAAAGRRTLRKVASRLDGSLDTIKNEQIQRDLRRAGELFFNKSKQH